MNLTANKSVYVGVFLIALATLVYEILLTRIFSVTTWYHFAFFAISLAMFGMTAGAIMVYAWRDRIAEERTAKYQALSAFYFSMFAVVAVLVHLSTPLWMPSDAKTIIVTSLVVATPFLLVAFCSAGICLSLALTRYPKQLNKLYGADLLGAATGCLLLVVSMQYLDGISNVFFVALLGICSAICFAMNTSSRKLTMSLAGAAVALTALLVASAYQAAQDKPIFSLFWSKGTREQRVLLERWNSFSRIRIFGQPDLQQRPLEFGYSPLLPKDIKIRQLWVDIDGCAAAILYKFNGDLKEYEFFKYDISNMAHMVRKGNALVIGVGGGKDILASLALGQNSVTGVEINNNIIDTVNRKFGDYTGHLDKNPKVTIVNDEARSYITRSNKKYDIIQATLVDTWAASSSGAYALTENSLYTVDAWRTFINHLTDGGILTVTRWYNKQIPAEIYRLVVLASTALHETGAATPRDHIVLVRLMNSELGTALNANDGLGTILVSKTPFSAADLDSIDNQAKELGYEVALSPRTAIDPNLVLASQRKTDELAKLVPFAVDPSTDDRPYFFQNLDLKHVFDPRVLIGGRNENNITSALCLLLLLTAVVVFSFYCFRLPLLMTKDRSLLQGTLPHFFYFSSIGAGFMLLEISQVQRFSIFLGHPMYSIVVVLFTLLLSTGLGSLFFNHMLNAAQNKPLRLLAGILVVIALVGAVSPPVVAAFGDHSTPERIALAGLSIFPLGFALGLAFPLGMKLANEHNNAITPWLWGANGAMSVVGSVVAVVISMFAGITYTYWFGAAFYILALLSCRKLSRSAKRYVS